ncbi:MAG: hypothetical protein JPMHGGIA_02403 [Saprospiraceae bacterium]|nr:hypothetical protein [Saprospiraceae bacterium]
MRQNLNLSLLANKIFPFLALAFCTSSFAQIQWTGGGEVSAKSFGNHYPRMAVDGMGNPLVIWGRSGDESVFLSRYNGVSFTTPIKLNGLLTVASANWMGADIASHGDTIYVVMKQTPESEPASLIHLVKSFNGGRSFTPPVRVDSSTGSISRFPAVACDPEGHPIVAFMKFDASFKESRWVVARSNDFGESFSMDQKASGWGNSEAVCDCCPGTIISQGNVCAMLYRNNRANIRDCWAGISTDRGYQFTDGFALENNNWNLMSCPSSSPDGIILDDTLYSVFMNGVSGKQRTYLSRSSLPNRMLSSITTLTETIPGLTLQDDPRIASDGTAAAIVWRQIAGASAQLLLLFTRNVANGFSASYDTVDLADITSEDVAMSNGNIYVVWADDRSGTVKYRFGQYTPSTTGNADPSAADFDIFPNPATDILNIRSNGSKPFSASIHHSTGRRIYAEYGIENCSLNIGDWADGIYFLQLRTHLGLCTKMFIKQ